MVNLVEAAQASIPFQALDVTIEGVVRHPDTRTAAFTVVLNPRNLTGMRQRMGRARQIWLWRR